MLRRTYTSENVRKLIENNNTTNTVMTNSYSQNPQEELNKYFDFFENCRGVQDDKEFVSFLTKLQDHPSKKYYFTLQPSKVDLFKKIFHLEKAGLQVVKLEFNWEHIRNFATDEQKDVFNTFRSKYVQFLVNQTCKPKTINNTNTNASGKPCAYEIIGTPATSVESDIDFSLSAIGENTIGEALDKIYAEHHKYFATELDELFDTNLYGSVFPFDKTLHNNPSTELIRLQNAWSWIRTVEILNKYVGPLLIAEFKNRLTDSHKEIFVSAHTNLRDLSQTTDNASYIQPKPFVSFPVNRESEKSSTPLKRYQGTCPINLKSRTEHYRFFLSAYSDTKQDFADKLECFSIAKYYENETYRSLGAVLHIVSRIEGIEKNYYAHSVYDQYGFIVENIFEHKIKGTNLINTVPKAAKYIARICDAIEKIGASTIKNSEGKDIDLKDTISNFYQIKESSKLLNDVRRTTDKNREKQLAEEFQKYFPVVSIANVNSKTNSSQTNDSQAKKINFLLGVYDVLIKPVGEFQDNLNRKQQGGKMKNKNNKRKGNNKKTKPRK